MCSADASVGERHYPKRAVNLELIDFLSNNYSFSSRMEKLSRIYEVAILIAAAAES